MDEETKNKFKAGMYQDIDISILVDTDPEFLIWADRCVEDFCLTQNDLDKCINNIKCKNKNNEKFYISKDEDDNCLSLSVGLPYRAKNIDGKGYWYSDGNLCYFSEELAFRILGRKLTWADEPVEVELKPVVK